MNIDVTVARRLTRISISRGCGGKMYRQVLEKLRSQGAWIVQAMLGRVLLTRARPEDRKPFLEVTGPENIACTWFGEVCTYPSLVSRKKLQQAAQKPLHIGCPILKVAISRTLQPEYPSKCMYSAELGKVNPIAFLLSFPALIFVDLKGAVWESGR